MRWFRDRNADVVFYGGVSIEALVPRGSSPTLLTRYPATRCRRFSGASKANSYGPWSRRPSSKTAQFSGAIRIQGNAARHLYPHSPRRPASGRIVIRPRRADHQIDGIEGIHQRSRTAATGRIGPRAVRDKNLVGPLVGAVREQNPHPLGLPGEALGMARASTYEELNLC